jgi:glucose dehydrogenase
MQLPSKQQWLDAAEVFDAWRLVPRSVLYCFGLWVILIVDRTLSWYFATPPAERSVQDAGLVTGVITAVTGVFGLTIKFYNTSGRQWAGQPTPRDDGR